ncbi:TIGR03826 family flagellar region protein [Bacillus horti]|uniref:Flagellar operon protein (TIGR03826 family) n=1 Tax=Caldalkalibacillus horti TaxID=77523 RepID=A0ABT9VZC9_9BACI|nr:TIGR03826 family flagellar region protein [Bacillus horti]MDQ0166346.1 flagellar operon protein (TIGR03826 family) [Bacillus horti]
MGFNQLDNCPKCGTLFVKGVRDVCNSCFEEEEKAYNAVANYLRKSENKKANINQVSEDTEVSIKLITKFIKQKRISLIGLPNMGYPCESCGVMTREGQLCSSCRDKFTKGAEKQNRQLRQEIEENQYKVKDTGYMHHKDKI